eukprot:Seg616.14 transcript_id=Seg616.14/GoldUCD/mRNA.D3Y31 product="hypothetical protein" protein_id=Seg616.14/GoldUCD/D3Y31
MSRRISLPARAIASEESGLDPVARPKSGSVSSDDGDLGFPKQGKFFKNLTRSLDPEVKPPPKKDYLDEYQKYKAKRAFSLHGVVKQQTIDLGTLGGPSTSSAAQAANRRFSTGMHPPQADVGKGERSATLPIQRGVTTKKGPPPPVAPRKKSVNLPPIPEPTKILTKLPSSPGHETPSYILSAAKKEKQKAEIEAHKPPPVAKKPQIVKSEAKQNNLPCDKPENETPAVHNENNNEKEEGILTKEENKAQEGESTGAREKEIAAESSAVIAVNDGVVVNGEGTVENLVGEAKGEGKGEPQATTSEDQGSKQAVDNERGASVVLEGEPAVEAKDTLEEIVSNQVPNDASQGGDENTPETTPKVVENEAQELEAGTKDEDSSVENVGVTSSAETALVKEVGSAENEASKDIKNVETENVTVDEISENVDIPEGDKQGVENHTEEQGVVSEQTESSSIPEEKPSVEEVPTGKEDIIEKSSTEKGVAQNNVSPDVPSEGGNTTATNEGVVSVNGVTENSVNDIGSATPNDVIPSTESTPTGNGPQSAGATEKLSKTADLLLSFSQDKKENLNANDGDLKGIGAELLKLNSTIEEISGANKKEEKVSQEDIEKMEEIDAMRREMEAMRQEMDLLG